jgi:ribose transport system substrate-binding protein
MMRPHRRNVFVFFVTLSVTAAIVGSCLAAETSQGLSPAEVAYLKNQIASHTGETRFTPPGPAIDPSALKGKLIFTIPLSTADPWCQVVDKQMEEFSSRLGLRFEVWQNTGQLAQWVQGFDTAINHKADLINVVCGLNPATVAPQIQAAKNHGIPVVAGHTYAIGQPTLPDLSGIVYGAYIEAAKLEIDWVILQTNGKANVLVITSPSTANSPYIQKTIEAEFAQHCGGCKARYVGVNVSDWGTKIEPQVRSAIIADKDLNYIIPIYDSMAQFVVPAIIATGASNRVKVASFNALPAMLDMVRTTDIYTFDVGEDTGWLAGAILDQDMRLLLKKPLIPEYAADVRIFTKDNVKEAGIPAKYGQGFGSSAVSGYEKLWGLK